MGNSGFVNRPADTLEGEIERIKELLNNGPTMSAETRQRFRGYLLGLLQAKKYREDNDSIVVKNITVTGTVHIIPAEGQPAISIESKSPFK